MTDPGEDRAAGDDAPTFGGVGVLLAAAGLASALVTLVTPTDGVPTQLVPVLFGLAALIWGGRGVRAGEPIAALAVVLGCFAIALGLLMLAAATGA